MPKISTEIKVIKCVYLSPADYEFLARLGAGERKRNASQGIALLVEQERVRRRAMRKSATAAGESE